MISAEKRPFTSRYTDATANPNAVAIVGLSCRYGPADSADSLWDLLSSGRSGIRRYSDEELIALGHLPETLRRKGFVPSGSVLPDAEAFDATFFGYSGQHAEWLDPQQRLLLETAWHALENAGVAPLGDGTESARTGVFMSLGQPTVPPVAITDLDAAGMTRFASSDKDFAATRISYKFGLTGPSMTVQTACSSSLVGVHLAVESLLGEECDIAVVGGVSLHFPQAGYVAGEDLIFSPSGGCRPFDDTSDGTVFGNGVGVVVLRRLTDALAGGDPIRAVIMGTAVGNDGGRKQDYHAPSPQGQESVIREALFLSGVDPHTVGYVEAHGTATRLGDSVEVASLARVYGGPSRRQPCLVGSVKNVVGHTNTAAGLAGLIKAVLVLEHGYVPAQHDFHRPNATLSLKGTGLVVGEGSEVWPITPGPRRAAVSSFGMGGTNAHVVLEQTPAVPAPAVKSDKPQLLVLSARTVTARDLLATRVAAAIDGESRVTLAQVAATLARGRSHLPERLALVARDLPAAVHGLRTGEGVVTGTATSHPGMGGAAPLGESLDAIARNWVTGTGGLPPVDVAETRVPLPGYPFERRRWPRITAAPAPATDPPVLVAAATGENHLPTASPSSVLSAMLCRRVEGLEGVWFERVILPDDPLVTDHLVGGEPVLPAAAQIDMALASVASGPAGEVPVLTDVTFYRPIRIREQVRLLAEVETGHIRIFSEVAGERVLHCEAGVELPSRHPAATVLTLGDRSMPKNGQPGAFLSGGDDTEGAVAVATDPSELYRRFFEGGVDYGPSFQVIEALVVADGVVEASVSSSRGGEHLVSPYLLDGVLQTVVGCWQRHEVGEGTYVPFSIARLSVHATACQRLQVEVRQLPLSGTGRVRRFNLSASTESGVAAILVEGLTLLPTATSVHEAQLALPAGVHLYTTVPDSATPVTESAIGQVVVLGEDERLAQVVASRLGVETVIRTLSDLDAGAAVPPVVVLPLTETKDRVTALVETTSQLLRSDLRCGMHVVVPYPEGAIAGPGIAAFGRSLTAEHSKCVLTAAAVDLTASNREESIADAVRRAVLTSSQGGHILADGRTVTIAPLPFPSPTRTAFIRGGRYWINGMGTLAESLAGYLLDQHAAEIVITGRSPATGERAAALARLAGRGTNVEYYQLDCTDPIAVRDFAARIRPVRGVFHLAGVLRDGPAARKTAADAQAVIDPKLGGALALDEATEDWSLDHFVVFSSVSGVFASPGQCDYAFANAAVDEFARRRATRRPGVTLSVAWPLWEGDGIAAGSNAASVLERFGMFPLPAYRALPVLEALLSSEGTPPTALVLYGDHQRLRTMLPLRHSTGTTVDPAWSFAAPQGGEIHVSKSDEEVLRDRVLDLVAEITRSPIGQIHPEDRFEGLGVDSLTAVQIIDAMEADFGRLPKTLLFECQTTAELAAYLWAEFPERCQLFVAGRGAETVPTLAESNRKHGVDHVGAVANWQAPTDQQSLSAGLEPIAIIGMAGHYPGGEDVDDLWQHLLSGDDLVTEVPIERWDAAAFYDAERGRPGRSYSRWGSFVDGVERFDAPLFAMSPREASVTDPQARLFLESCWSVFDDAGYRHDEPFTGYRPLGARDVGVFVGVMYGEYQLHEAEERQRGMPVLANSAYWSIANRASYFFDLKGPSLALDTACSSALTAIHMACESLRTGGCSMAIAGGVNVLIHPNKYLMLSQGRFLSSDGRCRSFGAGGDGYVPGEGVGTVLLKPLSRALEDGDHIHGVIRGSAVNHGGRANGYTVPSPKAQAAVVSRAWSAAGLSPDDADYIEAHGTGTSLGDPIEIRGLTMTMGVEAATAAARIPIGSVKSNLGHLESAAGVVAVHKVLLQLRHRTLVPSIHAAPSNPEIDFAKTPFQVQQQSTPWTSRSSGPLRAGINSFGAGGANAHVVIEEPPPRPAPGDDDGGPVIVFLSARTDAALAAYALALQEHIRAHRPRLADVAWTFAVGRVELARRRAIPARTLDELIARLALVADGGRLDVDEVTQRWEDGERLDLLVACLAAGRGRRTPLPHYPFERVRCWYDIQVERLVGDDRLVGQPQRSPLRDFGRERPVAASTGTLTGSVDSPPATGTAPSGMSSLTGPDVSRPASPPRLTPSVPGSRVDAMVSQRKITLRTLNRAAQPDVVLPVSARAETALRSPMTQQVPPLGVAQIGNSGTLDAMTELLAEVLYLSPGEVDAQTPFQELGVDSVLGVEFIGKINQRFGSQLKATALYDWPTLMELAAEIGGETHVSDRDADPERTSALQPAVVPTTAAPTLPSVSAQMQAPPSSVANDRVADVLAALHRKLAEVLYCDENEIDSDEAFSQLGLDSVLGVELTTFLNRLYGVGLKADALYDYSTPKALASHVAELQDSLSSASGPPLAPTVPGLDIDELLLAVQDGKVSADQATAMLRRQSNPIATPEEIFDVVRRHVVQVLSDIDPGQITIDGALRDLGANSIDRMDIVIGVQDELGITVPSKALADVTNLAALVAVLQDYM